MNKLRLTLEDLQIDSFSTTLVKKEKGTVYGEQCTCPTACTCPGCPTCDASCNGTCGDTCNCGTWDSCDSCSCDACESYDTCGFVCYTYQRGEHGYCEL